MRRFRLLLGLTAALLGPTACGQLNYPDAAALSPDPDASWTDGPDHWYVPMQIRTDNCYVGPNAIEVGSEPRQCPNPQQALSNK